MQEDQGHRGDIKEQAKQYIGIGSKWIRSAGSKIAKVAKERLDDLESARKAALGRGGEDGGLPAHYYEWYASVLCEVPVYRSI